MNIYMYLMKNHSYIQMLLDHVEGLVVYKTVP